ncbi:hypothetical protein EG327_011071 [Venturia inaequalis]|uniref:Uncharacterized protein n=1 Tax=Venturia inaequalis TaxID=5025 RepID=A0A8H3UD55_VENIN|nr:hypothetical protein EG327_011071 [Venturia inaequalis]
MAWECNKAQHQNACPDYSIGPACFGTMSWGHCDRGCAESVHVADGTWCSGTGVILALGVPVSTPGSQNPAPPPVPYNPGTAPGVAPNPTVDPSANPASIAAGILGNLRTAVLPAPSPPPPPSPATTPAKTPDPPQADPSPEPPKTPDPAPEPPKTTAPPETEEVKPGGCHHHKPDSKIRYTTPYAMCI